MQTRWHARAQVAALIGGTPAGVVFTSGATEANHLFLRGVPKVQVVAVSELEHPSVHDAMERLVRRGVRRIVLGTGTDGLTRLDTLSGQVDLISVMAANHETGILQPVDRILERAARIGAS